MAIFKNETDATSSNDRTPSQFWMNIGITIPIQKEDGSVEDTHVSLPVGLPLDSMEEQAVKGKSKDWRNLVQAKNGLLRHVKMVAEGLESGDAVVLDKFTVELRRTPAAQSSEPSIDNPLIGQLSAVLGKPAASSQEPASGEDAVAAALGTGTQG